MRWPGIEPGSTAWKAAMLTTIPPAPAVVVKCRKNVSFNWCIKNVNIIKKYIRYLTKNDGLPSCEVYFQIVTNWC